MLSAAAVVLHTAKAVARLTTSANVASSPPAVLHIYHHCPFCVRVWLYMGWNGVSHKVQVHGYSQPSATKVHPQGKKILPVLEVGGLFQSESGDIIELVRSRHACADLGPKSGRGDIEDWLEKFKPVQRKLFRPREVKHPMLTQPGWDFGSKEDVDYCRGKYTKQGFDFEAAEAETPELLGQMSELLSEFEALLQSDTAVTGLGPRGWDDLVLLPDLRSLTIVKGLVWPPRVEAYVRTACEEAGVDLYTGI